MNFKNITQYVLILMLAAGFTACSDNGSSAEEENQQPAIPELAANAQPDITFFQNNGPTAAAKGTANATVENFNAAKGVATGGASLLSSGYASSLFINSVANLDANFTNDQWVWEYNFSQDEGSGSIQTTAQPQDDGFSWETFVSFDFGEENSISDFKVMDGTTSNNGDRGSWRFFKPAGDENTPSPFLSSSWTVISETERNTELQLIDEEGNEAGTVSYERNGAENLMVLDLSEENEPAEVFWNTDTNEGYVTQDGETTCWGSDFQDVECS